MPGTTRQHARILVIDDDQGIWKSYRLVLSPDRLPPGSSSDRMSQLLVDEQNGEAGPGFTLVFASQGQEGYHLIEAAKEHEPFAMAFIDIRMPPGWDGMETAIKIRQLDPDIELVIVTAYSDRSMEEIVRAVGASDKLLFLRKPFDPDELKQMACCLTSKWQIAREEEQQRQARRFLEEQFHQAQKMESVGRLAGGVAHDFNNMLSVIIGYADLALERLGPADPIAAYLQSIKQAGKRSADIVRQLLAFARKQSIAPKVLDLNDTIEGMLKMLRRLIGEDITLLWKPAGNLEAVTMDSSQIDQILANLVVNARDAIPGNGTITIETGKAEFDQAFCEQHPGCQPGPYLFMAVSDDGCGMDQETMRQIYEPFFTTKPLGQGTGLGLATVYGIAQQNNGFIEVYSQPGEGTTFKVYLPQHRADAAALDETAKQGEVSGGTETVLLVEDEASVLEFVSRALENLGYRVMAANSPNQGMQIAEGYAGEIHLLVTDVIMPEMNGRDLQKCLTAKRPGLKCLFMSGFPDNVIAQHGILDNGVHFLQKPFSKESLAAKLREALGNH